MAEVLLHPDEAVSGAIRTVFERFTEMGSARQVWLWFRQQGLRFPRYVDDTGRVLKRVRHLPRSRVLAVPKPSVKKPVDPGEQVSHLGAFAQLVEQPRSRFSAPT